MFHVEDATVSRIVEQIPVGWNRFDTVTKTKWQTLSTTSLNTIYLQSSLRWNIIGMRLLFVYKMTHWISTHWWRNTSVKIYHTILLYFALFKSLIFVLSIEHAPLTTFGHSHDAHYN
jgi:hypothetical protein